MGESDTILFLKGVCRTELALESMSSQELGEEVEISLCSGQLS